MTTPHFFLKILKFIVLLVGEVFESRKKTLGKGKKNQN
jgi:hypothetical protein